MYWVIEHFPLGGDGCIKRQGSCTHPLVGFCFVPGAILYKLADW